MYRLVMASQKPIAHVFHDWICHGDVLLTIRETGRYDVAEEIAHAAETNTRPEQVHALEILHDKRITHSQLIMFL
jgi:prophage antirepressor-like protein